MKKRERLSYTLLQTPQKLPLFIRRKHPSKEHSTHTGWCTCRHGGDGPGGGARRSRGRSPALDTSSARARGASSHHRAARTRAGIAITPHTVHADAADAPCTNDSTTRVQENVNSATALGREQPADLNKSSRRSTYQRSSENKHTQMKTCWHSMPTWIRTTRSCQHKVTNEREEREREPCMAPTLKEDASPARARVTRGGMRGAKMMNMKSRYDG